MLQFMSPAAMDKLAGKAMDPAEEAEERELCDRVRGIVRRLPARERMVVSLLHNIGATWCDTLQTARVLKTGGFRVCALEERVMRRLKRPSYKRLLREFLDPEIGGKQSQ